MEQGILISVVLLSAALAYALGAAGGATMAFLAFPRLSRPAQGLVACLPAPSILALMVLVIVGLEGQRNDPAALIGVLAILFVPSLVVGWPSAFLTLRALERREERAGVKAQEIFE